MNFITSLLLNIYKLFITNNPVLTILFTIIFVLFILIYYYLFKIRRFDNGLQHYVIKEQMIKAEEGLDEIESYMLSLYLCLKNELNIDKTCIDDIDTKRFVLFNKFLKDRANHLIRQFFKDNHLTVMTEKEFEAHITSRAQRIIRTLQGFFNEWFISGGQPTTTEFWAGFVMKELARSENKIEQIFREGRIISYQFKNKKFLKDYF